MLIIHLFHLIYFSLMGDDAKKTFKEKDVKTELPFSPPSYDEAIISPKGFVAPPITQYPPPASIYPYLKPENQSPPEEESSVTPPSESHSADYNSSSKTGNISPHNNGNISPLNTVNISPLKSVNMPPPAGRLSPSQGRRRHQLHETGPQVKFNNKNSIKNT